MMFQGYEISVCFFNSSIFVWQHMLFYHYWVNLNNLCQGPAALNVGQMQKFAYLLFLKNKT